MMTKKVGANHKRLVSAFVFASAFSVIVARFAGPSLVRQCPLRAFVPSWPAFRGFVVSWLRDEALPLLGDRANSWRSWLGVCIREVPARLVHEPRDLFHLHVVNLFRPVVLRVVVGMQSGHEADGGHSALQKRPLIAAAHEVRAVVVVPLLHVEPGSDVAGVRPVD